MFRPLHRSVVALALTLLSASAAGAQDTLYLLLGDDPGDTFGFALSGVDDVDGDGTPDLVVGARRDDTQAPNAGSVRLYSGSNGALLLTLLGDAAGDELGAAVAPAGDVNGDGIADIAVGAPYADGPGASAGLVRLHSGLDGALLVRVPGAVAGERFGAALALAGDVNGDGFDDLVVGAPAGGVAGAGAGAARVLSGAPGALGSVLLVIDGSAPGDALGAAVAGVGDLDGDGFADVAVGAPGAGANAGELRVVSGATGLTLFQEAGTSAGDRLGVAVAGIGDLDGDGTGDVAVGAGDGGYVQIFSGASGALLDTLVGDAPGDGFGVAVAAAGDVNGDGAPDLVVGSDQATTNGLRAGRVTVFSGITRQPLFRVDGGSAFDRFGAAVAGPGDLDGDGFADVIAGAPDDAVNGLNSGSVRAVAGSDRVGEVTCPGQPNSTGIPSPLEGRGTAIIANADLVLTATELPPMTTGLFLASPTGGFVAQPGGSSGILCLGGAIGRYVGPGQLQSSGASGRFILTVDAAQLPTPTGIRAAVSGETWHFQAWYRDVIGGLGIPTSNFTGALAVTFF